MRLSTVPCLLLAAALCGGCAPPPAAPVATTAAPAPAPLDESAAMHPASLLDEHSYAEPAKVRTTNLALDLAIDFPARQLHGTATHTLRWIDPLATELVLDTDVTAEQRARRTAWIHGD